MATEETVTIGCGTTSIFVSRMGQQAPRDGDGVVVRAHVQIATTVDPLQLFIANQQHTSLRMPAAVDGTYISDYLPKEIRFDYRCKVAGETVTDNWGELVPGGKWRERVRDFVAQSWSLAEADALDWARTEAGKRCRLQLGPHLPGNRSRRVGGLCMPTKSQPKWVRGRTLFCTIGQRIRFGRPMRKHLTLRPYLGASNGTRTRT